jgi:hypothetical protein
MIGVKMKKLVRLIILPIVLFFAMMTGCALNNETALIYLQDDIVEQTELRWAAVPAVYVNDTWYRIYDDRQHMVQEPDDRWTYLGGIQSIVPGYESPTVNFQANFEQIGARIYHSYEALIPVTSGSWPASIDEEVIGDSIIVIYEGHRTMFISEATHDEVMIIMDAVKRDSLFIDGNLYSLMASTGGAVIDLDDEHIFIGEVQSAVSVYEYPTENLQANRESAVGAKVYRLPLDHTDDIVIFHFPGGYNFYSLLPGYNDLNNIMN